MAKAPDVAETFAGIKVIDADTHWTEPHDLWTKRAPTRWRDRVPRVEEVDGKATWVVDGRPLGWATGGATIGRDGRKQLRLDVLFEWGIDDVITAAYDVTARLELMDRLGIWAHIVFPNNVGLGGERFGNLVPDEELRLMCVMLFNDAMAELQDSSGGRLYPMAVLPSWNVELAVREVERVHSMGLRGVNTTSEPDEQGAADFADGSWDSLWSACADLGMPLHFHTGASVKAMTYFGEDPWSSHDDHTKLALGSALLTLGNARVVANVLCSGMLSRHPRLKVVSVESGIGWIPFLLDALDFELAENAPAKLDELGIRPSELFRRQVYACFWFEHRDIATLVEAIGPHNVMFETDFPHPTCLYPDPLATAARNLADVDEATRRNLVSTNAARLYSIDVEGVT
jgi:predicted TIM-barrel fold metal-dependent hydrolase